MMRQACTLMTALSTCVMVGGTVPLLNPGVVEQFNNCKMTPIMLRPAEAAGEQCEACAITIRVAMRLFSDMMLELAACQRPSGILLSGG